MNKTLIAAALAALIAFAPAAVAKKKHKQQSSLDVYFAQFDRDGNGLVSRAEFPGDDVQFGLVDRNRDGAISKAEVRQALKNGGGAEREFARLDVNHDGVVSRGEWHGDAAAFAQLDRNRDGVLSRADLRR
jgi:Ca2+-binding EF-hand superfamily protein